MKLEGVERFILKKIEIEFIFFNTFIAYASGVHERFVPVPEVGQVILGATCGSAVTFLALPEKCFLSVSLALLIYKQRSAGAGTPRRPQALRAVLFSFLSICTSGDFKCSNSLKMFIYFKRL